MTTDAAPRDSASKPSAPLPANRSRQALPLKSWPSQLNTVSRTRSGVGLRSSASGNSTRRLRHSPPMMRTVLRLVRRTDDHDREPSRIDAVRERGAYLIQRHRLQAGWIRVEPVERQPIKADDRQLLEELAVGVDAQGKAAHQALFRRVELA